ncbi:MAG: uroporphyrinogen-III synthase [Bacteroidales bacterium]|nr:uroporphyrinogen-III synthase [Bacteroidales bacterium]
MKVKNILISQNAPVDFAKSPYAELTKKYSVNIDFYKFFKFEAISSAEFRQSKVNILNHTAIIFSSQVAIDYFFQLAQDMRIEIPETMKYFCPTENIAHYLQRYIQFRKRKIFFPKNNTPAGIFELFSKNTELSYLIPCSSESQGSKYAEYFEENGISYSNAVVFKSIPAEVSNDIDITKYDMLVFFSPVGVQSLKKNFPFFKQNENIAIGALGAAVTQALEMEGFTVNVKAPTKEAPSITSAIDLFLKDNATKRR